MVKATLAAAALGALLNRVVAFELEPSDIVEDDACVAAGGDAEACALNALQLRGMRVQQPPGDIGPPPPSSTWWFDDADNEDDDGDDDQDDGDDIDDEDDNDGDETMEENEFEADARPSWEAEDAGDPLNEEPVFEPQVQQRECADLDDPVNAECAKVVRWAAGGGKNDPKASRYFADMSQIAGVDYKQANENDFQRLYYCSPPGGKQCRAPPCECSKPPCNKCLVNQPHAASPATGCDAGGNIACKPPKLPMDYNGMSWPTMTFEGDQTMHIFAIGDWGGMDGSLNPIEDRPAIIAYHWGARPGPSVFPRTRWDREHETQLCNHTQFVACFNSRGSGPDCPASCGYVNGVDDQPQQLVAKAFAARASKSDPSFILNVGDNFYWGGIEKTCGTPMDEISFTANHQFNQIFEQVYNGAGLSGKKWISVLGNHDWGGRVFNNGWDQQIAYTWASDRWVLPAPYYMVHVDYPDQGFSADIYMFDSNFNDAKSPEEDPEHNLCGSKHNPPGASCSVVGGPKDIESCPSFFAQLWGEQKVWLTKKLSQSKATWQIGVTHFPCGEDGEGQAFYRKLHTEYGLDLLVTGHRHDQEMWLPSDTAKNHMGGLTCLVTGGGGGITSEATPDPDNTKDWYGEAQYGFYDITITKSEMTIESINWDGKLIKSTTVSPS